MRPSSSLKSQPCTHPHDRINGQTNRASYNLKKGRFLKLAVAWTAARGQRLSGDPALCGLLGRCLWNEGERDRGMRYLVLGERPQELCDLILQDLADDKERYDTHLCLACVVLLFVEACRAHVAFVVGRTCIVSWRRLWEQGLWFIVVDVVAI